MAKQKGLYKKTNKHDHRHTLINTVYYQLLEGNYSFNLLLKYLTEENSFRDEGSWFQILLALYLTVVMS